jgi:hypothetical protein
MKAINVIRKIWVLLLITPAFFMAGCSKNFDVPPVEIPTFILPDGASLISIDSLKSRHTNPAVVDSIKDDIYVTGIVVSSDETGNIYKSLYIQDTTGGLLISLDATSLYNLYRIGQRIYVKCQGLRLGEYGGMIQLGALYNGAIGRISAPLIPQYLFLDGLPGPVPAAKVITIPTITSKDLGRLVKLENVHFETVGLPFADPGASTNRNIVDLSNNKLIMRSSNYATFHTTLLPGGTGTIYGILGIFGSDNQLYIRDLNDLVGFDFSAALILNEPFTSGIGSFTTYNSLGSQVWTYSSSYGMTMTGHATSNFDNQDWLISPSVNLTQVDSVKLSFSHTINFGVVANMQTNHTLWASKNYTSGDPSLATWEQLTIPTYPAGSNWTFVASGDVLFPASYSGESNVHFAFKYLSTTSDAATWEIKSVLLKGKNN